MFSKHKERKINQILNQLRISLFTHANVIEIEGLLFPDYGQVLANARSMENCFFPSSDITRALKNGALLLKNFERPRDITLWEKLEKPVFHGVPAFAKTRE